ncbi:MAG: Ribosomal large subunit pseudouridine synthase B [Syntrophomonadaceae bacterium]|nr:Ribosomal large subunit pseudouridine synthase B [Bacillota bacterium]
MRLQKFLAAAGICSRRAAEEMIAEGRVRVNGVIVTSAGTTVKPERDLVEVDNKRVFRLPEKVCLLLYKPTGCLTSLYDAWGRPTVGELVRDAGIRLFPVGRLDLETSGALLLTNDGELAHRLTHPSFGVPKEYLARVGGLPTPPVLQRLRTGVPLEDGITAPAKVSLVKKGRASALVSLIIHEGRNRQVRRMLAAVGHPVLSLKRVRFGPLTLTSLQPGEWRRLREDEVNALREAVKGF